MNVKTIIYQTVRVRKKKRYIQVFKIPERIAIDVPELGALEVQYGVIQLVVWMALRLISGGVRVKSTFSENVQKAFIRSVVH